MLASDTGPTAGCTLAAHKHRDVVAADLGSSLCVIRNDASHWPPACWRARSTRETLRSQDAVAKYGALTRRISQSGQGYFAEVRQGYNIQYPCFLLSVSLDTVHPLYSETQFPARGNKLDGD